MQSFIVFLQLGRFVAWPSGSRWSLMTSTKAITFQPFRLWKELDDLAFANLWLSACLLPTCLCLQAGLSRLLAEKEEVVVG